MTQLGTRKSRKGCTNCKRRRVKCNEEAPCANCTRRREPCSLLCLPTEHCEASPPPPNTDLPQSPEEWLQDLELMHHYSRDTLLQPLGIRDDMHHLWREHVPREATRFPFLMHGILALSALHIAHEQPHEAEHYMRLCDKHHSRALEMFRTVLRGHLSPDMSTALFALSTTISIHSMARSCVDALSMPEPRYISMEQVAELFLLTRGVKDLIDTCIGWVLAGPLGPIFDDYRLPAHRRDGSDVQQQQQQPPLPASVQRQFGRLRRMLAERCAGEYRGECEAALAHLESLYRDVARVAASGSGHVETCHIWEWMSQVTLEFVRLITACYPPALVLLANYAAVSMAMRKTWNTNGWGNFVLTGISIALRGTEMHGYLQWPMEQARHNMTILTRAEEIDSVVNSSSPSAVAKIHMDQACNLEREMADVELYFEPYLNLS